MRFGRYQLKQRLAAGGMGEVFVARADGANEDVVVKRLLPHLGGDEALRDALLEEARIGAWLSHPNVVRVLEVAHVDERWFIAMEYVRGASLAKALEWGALPCGLACAVASQVAAALDHAHRARDGQGRPLGVVHGDVSPSNVLLGFSGEVRLIDFGVARVAGGGKYAYFSPEQAAGEPLTPQSDQFSLGLVLWEMLTGKPRYDGESDVETLAQAEAAEPPGVIGVATDALEPLLVRLLAREPGARYPDCRAVRQALADAQLELGDASASEALGAWLTARVK